MTLHSATSAAPGKVILAGEHFAVYGRPAIALPLLAVSTQVTVQPAANDQLDAALGEGDLARARTLVQLARARVPGWADQPVHVRVDGSVPVGMGLGSSAAFAVALTRSLSLAAGLRWGPEAVREVAHALERSVHGDPSGLDDTVIAYGAPVLFRRGALPEPIAAGAPFELVLASVGYAGSTYEAVAGVRRLADARPAWFEGVLAEATDQVAGAADAFRRGDAQALGPRLNALHHLLSAVGVSCPDLDRLVDAARGAGALGAKLVGAGCGGFMLALAEPGRRAAVAQALRESGGSPVLEMVLEPRETSA